MSDYTTTYDPTKTIEEYKNEIINELLQINPAIDVSEGTPMMNIISVLTTALYNANNLSMSMYLDQSPLTASMQSLINKYCFLYGIEWQAGSKTKQIITIKITEPCTIYSDTTPEHTRFLVQSLATGNIYGSTITKTFTEDDIGNQDILCEAIDYGEIKDSIGTITEILTTTRGIESCINNVSFSLLGSDVESEEALRRRLLQASRYYKTAGMTETTEDDIRNLGFDDGFIVKNYTSTTRYEIPSGFVAIIVKGVQNDENNKKLAELLEKNFQSAKMFGFDNISVFYPLYKDKYICETIFNYAVPVDIYIKVSVRPASFFDTATIDKLKDYIIQKAIDNGLNNIYKTLTITDFTLIVKQFFDDNNMTSAYCFDIELKQTGEITWVRELVPQHIYTYYEIPKSNIEVITD